MPSRPCCSCRRFELGGIEWAHEERPTVATGAPAPSARAERHLALSEGDPHPQLPCPLRHSGHVRPRPRAAAARPAPRRPGRWRAGRSRAEPGGWRSALLLGLLLGQRYLGVDLLALPPGSVQALEGGAVAEAVLGEDVIEVVDLERLGSLGGPGLEGLWGLSDSAERTPSAFRVHSPAVLIASGREWIAISRLPSSPGPETVTWIATAPASGRTRGACRVSSSTLSAADLLSPLAGPARGRRCRATARRSPTAWSASQGWVERERRPVRVRPSPLGSSPARGGPSSGWSAATCPIAPASPRRR